MFVIALLVSAITFSQSKVNVQYFQLGTWSDYKRTWIWEPLKATDVTITIGKTFISINNKSGTELSVISYEGNTKGRADDGSSYSNSRWYCSDDKGKRCYFSMTAYSDGIYTYSIMYDDVVFKYIYKTNAYLND